MECNVGKLTLSDIWRDGQQGRPLLPPLTPPPLSRSLVYLLPSWSRSSPQYFRFSSLIFPYTTYMYMYFQGNESSIWNLNVEQFEERTCEKYKKWLCTVWKRFPPQCPSKNERLRSVLSVALYSPPLINTIGLADSLSGFITQGRRGAPLPTFKSGAQVGSAPPPTFGQNNCSTCNFTICG